MTSGAPLGAGLCRNTGGKGYLPHWCWHSAYLWTRGPQGPWCRSDYKVTKPSRPLFSQSGLRSCTHRFITGICIISLDGGRQRAPVHFPVKHPRKLQKLGAGTGREVARPGHHLQMTTINLSCRWDRIYIPRLARPVVNSRSQNKVIDAFNIHKEWEPH